MKDLQKQMFTVLGKGQHRPIINDCNSKNEVCISLFHEKLFLDQKYCCHYKTRICEIKYVWITYIENSVTSEFVQNKFKVFESKNKQFKIVPVSVTTYRYRNMEAS
jgi:hypothetical protein